MNTKNRDKLFFINENKNSLLITVGDSWTWGASFKDESISYRSKHTYGRYLKDHLKCDWINYGYPGGGNNLILYGLEFLLSKLIDNYCPYIDKQTYNIIKGSDWLDYSENLNFLDNKHINEIKEHYFKNIKNNEFINISQDLENVFSNKKYQKIYIVFTLTETGRDFDNSTVEKFNSVEDMLKFDENFLYKKLSRIKNFDNKKIKLIVGRNFTIDYPETTSISLKKNWVQINFEKDTLNKCQLSDTQKKGAVSGVAFHCFNNYDIVDKKEYVVKQIDYVKSLWDWLYSNSLNYNSTTCHPTEESHKLWAEYLKQYLE